MATLALFLVISSLAITALGYVASTVRSHYQVLITRKLVRTGFIALEILTVLPVTVALERMLF